MKHILSLITLVLFFSCSTNTANEEINPTGNYSLKTFKMKNDQGIEIDLMIFGSDLQLNLNSDKTFSGNLSINITGSDNQANDDFSGTYEITGNQITFITTKDIFLRDDLCKIRRNHINFVVFLWKFRSRLLWCTF